MSKLTGIFVAAALGLSGPAHADTAAAVPGGPVPTVLSGAQEVPTVVTDTTGQVRLRFNRALSQISFALVVRNGVQVIQAHLHCARAGVNGPVVVFLFGPAAPPVDVDGLLARGTIENDQLLPQGPTDVCPVAINNVASLFQAARDGLIYANVHTTANPGGEVRGQVFP